MSDRSFTIHAVYRHGKKMQVEGGRYISETASGAARKMFSQIYQDMRPKGRITLEIHVRETTQGSMHKIYKYKVTKKSHPTEVNINGQTIIYKFITKVKSI